MIEVQAKDIIDGKVKIKNQDIHLVINRLSADEIENAYYFTRDNDLIIKHLTIKNCDLNGPLSIDLFHCVVLKCEENSITSLPDLLECKVLECGMNKIKELPEIPQVVKLSCLENKIRVLPELPYCKVLECGQNKLKELPDLPEVLVLNCMNNKIKKLPELNKCVKLYCGYNRLTELPNLPNVEELGCFDNEIDKLPKMNKIQSLYCSDTKIKVIENLPNLEILHCGSSLVKKISNLPKLKELYCNDTQIEQININWNELETASINDTPINHRLIPIYVKLIEINSNFTEFEPAKKLIHQGLTKNNLENQVDDMADEAELNMIQFPMNTEQLSSKMDPVIVPIIDMYYKLFIVECGIEYERIYRNTQLHKKLLENLYNKHQDEINKDWSREQVIKFLFDKQFEFVVENSTVHLNKYGEKLNRDMIEQFKIMISRKKHEILEEDKDDALNEQERQNLLSQIQVPKNETLASYLAKYVKKYPIQSAPNQYIKFDNTMDDANYYVIQNLMELQRNPVQMEQPELKAKVKLFLKGIYEKNKPRYYNMFKNITQKFMEQFNSEVVKLYQPFLKNALQIL